VVKARFCSWFWSGWYWLPSDINTKGSILRIKTLADLMKIKGFGHRHYVRLWQIGAISGLSLKYSAPNFGPFEVLVWQLRQNIVQFWVKISVSPGFGKPRHAGFTATYPDEAKLSFSGHIKSLKTKLTLLLLDSPDGKAPKDMICIPDLENYFSKMRGIWPAVGEIISDKLKKKSSKAIKNCVKADFF